MAIHQQNSIFWFVNQSMNNFNSSQVSYITENGDTVKNKHPPPITIFVWVAMEVVRWRGVALAHPEGVLCAEE